MELSPDTQLHNRYTIVRLLGQGGMGAVYLANDTSLDQEVAVKVNYRPGEDSSSQFYREARLLASLRHQHLPRVIDYFVIANNQFLVMDFIPGEDLGALIARENIQPLDKVLSWAKQLGEALIYLHSQHPPVVHRDIKPANIKITPTGELILVDFGIAKASETSQATSTGASGYTPGFAPPEQYGATRTGPYTDQFSFAATLYMLLTGQCPADSIERTLNQKALTHIREINPAVPEHIQQTIEKGMALRPDERFASVREFLSSLTGDAGAEKKAIADSIKPMGEATQVAPHDEAESPETPAAEPEAGTPAATQLAPAEKPAPPAPQPAEATYVAPSAARPEPVEPRASTGSVTGSIGSATGSVSPAAGAAGPTAGQRPEPVKTVMQAAAGATMRVPMPAAPAVPAAVPKPGARRSPLLIAAGAVLLLGLLVGGFFIIRGLSNPAASPTPAPTLPIVANLPSATHTEPAASETPAATATVEPSQTPEPTLTSIPSPTLEPIGGGGVVAFSSDRGDGSTLQIWTMNVYLDNSGRAYSGEPQQLTFDEGDKTQPAWSPDGKRLLYVAPGGEGFGLDIWLTNADGSEPVNLTKKKGDDTDPAWSPDGKLIAFTNNGRSDGIRQVFTVAPDGSGLARISFDQEEYMPIFSPDGKNLAYVMFVASHEVLYLRSSSSEFQEFTRFDNVELLGRLGYVQQPAYSPDGAWLAYTRPEGLKSSRTRIYSVRVASRGGDIARLTEDLASRDPAWSPDSDWIVFTSSRDGNPEVYIMSNNGQFQVNLSNLPGIDQQPDWQPLTTP